MKKRAPKSVFVLFDAEGELCGMYDTAQEAAEDAVGPRFRSASRVVEYIKKPVTRKKR